MNKYKKLFIRKYIQFFPKGFVYFGHGVSNTIKDDYIQSLHLDFPLFKNMIEFWEQLGFEFLSADQLAGISRNQFRYNKSWLHLTFDDGYENNYSVIYPFLKSKNIPFSIFISTNHIEKNERFYTYRIKCSVLYTKKSISFPEYNLSLSDKATDQERKDFIKKISSVFKTLGREKALDLISKTDALLDKDEWEEINNRYDTDSLMSKLQILQLSKDPLVSIGSHCHNHIILNNQVTADEIRLEMEQSKNWILDTTGKKPCGFCYPNGTINDFNRLTKSICMKTGYNMAFTTVDSFVNKNTDALEIPRIFMFPNYKVLLKSMIKGKR